MTAFDHIVYGLLWLSFGAIHSLLAGNPVKDSLPSLFGRGYRLAYNLFSGLHIALVIVGGDAFNNHAIEPRRWPRNRRRCAQHSAAG